MPRNERITAGDPGVLNGDALEGGNQESRVIILKSGLHAGKDRYINPPWFRNYPVVGNRIIGSALDGDIKVSDYSGAGLFRKGKEVSVLSIRKGAFNIIIPLSARDSTGVPLEQTIDVDLVPVFEDPAALAGLLDGDYTEMESYTAETHLYRTARSISDEMANFLIDDAQIAIGSMEASVTILEMMFAVLQEVCRDDGFLAARGLRVVNASCRFSESATDEIRRLATEGRIDAERYRVEFENGQAVLRYRRMMGGVCDARADFVGRLDKDRGNRGFRGVLAALQEGHRSHGEPPHIRTSREKGQGGDDRGGHRARRRKDEGGDQVTIAEKKTVMEIEAVVDDIARIVDGVPSEYSVPSAELEVSRGLMCGSPRKSLKHAERARELYRTESEVAAMHGRISGAVTVSSEPEVSELERRYHEAILAGDYRAARKAVAKLIQLIDFREVEPLRFSSFEEVPGGCSFTISSVTDRTVVVTGLRVFSGCVRLSTDPLPSFVMQPLGERRITCSALGDGSVGRVTAVLEFEYSGRSRTVSFEFGGASRPGPDLGEGGEENESERGADEVHPERCFRGGHWHSQRYGIPQAP